MVERVTMRLAVDAQTQTNLSCELTAVMNILTGSVWGALTRYK